MPEDQAEQVPAEESAESVAPENMSDEQLLSAISEIEEEAWVEPGEIDEPVPAVEVEPVEEPTTEAEPVEPVKAEEKTEIPDDIELLRQEMQARFDKEKAERERWEYLAQQRQGELQHIKTTQPAPLQEDMGYESQSAGTQDVRHQIREVVREETAPLRQNATTQAITEEVNAMQQRRPDFMELSADVGKLVAERLPEFQGAITDGSPKMARVMVKSLLEGAYADVKLARLDAMREEAKKRRADQAEGLIEEKRAAVISGSTSPAQPLTPTMPKSPSQMSDKELLEAVREIERSPG